MKIYFEYEFKSEPWGGGNQFLKNLYEKLDNKNYITNKVKEADIVVFNSHHKLKKNLYLKFINPKKIFIHRIDGPLNYRGSKGGLIDNKIFNFNNLLADGTVFQSNWSMIESFKNGYKKNNFEKIISNAPNNKYFNNYDKSNFILDKNIKIKLISASWSSNENKGFDIYRYLDDNLDFDKYDMVFIGNSPDVYKNIKQYTPTNNFNLANFFKKSDIFIFPSKYESCSNILQEALNCKLPSVVRNSSSNPEFIYSCGELFNNKVDIISKIELITNNYSNYNNFSKLISLDEISNSYIDFFNCIIANIKANKYINKKINILSLLKYMIY